MLSKMKFYKYILILLLLGFCSCTPELSEQVRTGEKCLELTLRNIDMSTKVSWTETSDNGTASERRISRLDIFLYKKGSTGDCQFHAQRKELDNTTGSMSVSVYIPEDILTALGVTKKDGDCDVCVIANLPDDITFDSTDNTSKAELRALVVSSEEFGNVVASDGSFNAPESFIMYGETTTTNTHVHGNQYRLDGTVNLTRAASKITMNLWIPEYVDVKVKDENGDPVIVDGKEKVERWVPYFADPADTTKGISLMHMGFHKGQKYTYIEPPVGHDPERDPNDLLSFDDIEFETGYSDKFTYKRKDEDLKYTVETKDSRTFYLYSCDVSFYSYAFTWKDASNDLNAPFFTLMIPWVREGDGRYQTYYYQVVVNGQSKQLMRNKWYNITLTIDKLGSRVQNQAFPITDQQCYVLDWANAHSDVDDNTSENVTLKEWRYLVVDKEVIEMNNTNVGYLPFDASHAVAWNVVEAYYEDCSGNVPTKAFEQDIKNNCFTVDDNHLKLTYKLSDTRFAPVYIDLDLWLDFDGDNFCDESLDEDDYKTRVKFIMYPPIYIVSDKSSVKSIYVNGHQTRNYGDGDLDSQNWNIRINNNFNLGVAHGTGSSEYMYVISVSSFDGDDKFVWKDGQQYRYLIGDPRVTVPDNNLNPTYNMSANPVENPKETINHTGWALDSEGTILEHYYPASASTEGNVYQVIAPKFRVVSLLSSGYSHINKEGAAMRCASYQEDGFPAGRWRLPTSAEIMFIIGLQGHNAIRDLFYGGNSYYSSTDIIKTTNAGGFDSYNTTATEGSVRCVYDEWYWGSKRDANLNPSYNENYVENGNPTSSAHDQYIQKYLFTWGDRPM